MEAFYNKFRDTSNKEKTIKGVRTVGGKDTMGVGLCKEGGGPGTAATRKRPQVLPRTKDGALLCARGGFPFTQIGCSTTQEQISPSSLLCRSLSHCHSLVSPLYQHGKRGGGQSQTEEKGRTRRGARSL